MTAITAPVCTVRYKRALNSDQAPPQPERLSITPYRSMEGVFSISVLTQNVRQRSLCSRSAASVL
jgi:hypothetical protein